jgi:transcriptional regulator with XRE-family HTH domain
MIRITGNQIAAGRVLAGLSRQELADKASVSYGPIGGWERSTSAIPEATYSHLIKAIDALEAEGVRFGLDGSVRKERPASPQSVLQSEARA